MIVQTSTTCNPRQFVVQVIVLVLEFLQMLAQSAESLWLYYSSCKCLHDLSAYISQCFSSLVSQFKRV